MGNNANLIRNFQSFFFRTTICLFTEKKSMNGVGKKVNIWKCPKANYATQEKGPPTKWFPKYTPSFEPHVMVFKRWRGQDLKPTKTQKAIKRNNSVNCSLILPPTFLLPPVSKKSLFWGVFCFVLGVFIALSQGLSQHTNYDQLCMCGFCLFICFLPQ